MSKRLFLFLFFCFFLQKSISQNKEQLSPIQKHIYEFEIVQIKPEFPGGNDKFIEYVSKNFDKKTKESISGSFIIEMDGSVSNVVINNNIELKVIKELRKVFQNSPKWLCGEHEGYHVRTKMNFTFNLK
jgi:hypothetical protein